MNMLPVITSITKGERFEVTYGRPHTRQNELDTEPVLVCPSCGQSYIGAAETNRAVCNCGQDLTIVFPRIGLKMCDMFAQRRANITADEEERQRRGYEITYHYRKGGQSQSYDITTNGEPEIPYVPRD